MPARSSTSDAQSVVIFIFSIRNRSEALNFIKNFVGLIESEFMRRGVRAMHCSESDGAGSSLSTSTSGAESSDRGKHWRHGNARAKNEDTGLQQALLKLGCQFRAIANHEQPAGCTIDRRRRIQQHPRCCESFPRPRWCCRRASMRIRLPVARLSR